MKALVTGAAGFIGAHVVQALAARGIEVVATDRPGARWPALADALGPAIRYETDLNAEGATAALAGEHRPDLLVHLAWYARPQDYLASRENLRSLEATIRMTEAALDAGCTRIVGVGTCLEYAPSDRPHRESDPTVPEEMYSSCKHAARLVAEQMSAAGGASFAWARVFHLHGPGEDPRRIVPMVADKLRRGEAVDLSPGEQVRDYLRVEDVADAIATVAISEATGTVNVCSGAPTRLRELLLALGSVIGRPELLRFGALPYRKGERMCIAGVPEALGRLGWAPRHSTPADSLRYLSA